MPSTGANDSEASAPASPATPALGGRPARSRSLTWRQSWTLSLGPLVIGAIASLLTATYRFVEVRGTEHLDALLAGGRPVILASWHNRMLVCGQFLRKYLIRRGRRIAVLSSHSRDGELFARVATKGGFEVVRGSTSHGGLQGLRNLHHAITKDGICVCTAPDGPRGPVYVCKSGTVVLAQLAGVSIVPLAYAAERAWRVRSWDRLIVPKPFSRVVIVVGEPIPVPAELASDDLEAGTKELGRTLDALVREAENRL